MKRGLTIYKRKWKAFAQFLACMTLVALAGGATGTYLAEDAGAMPQEQPAVPYAAVYSSDNPIPAIVQNVRPAVVQVINILEVWSRQDGSSRMDQGYGSGVLIDTNGHIVTNYHVVQDADLVEIETLDGRRIRCDIAGYDSGTDIAVLKALESVGAQPVPLGDSDALVIGELAVAIGNPGVSQGVLFGTVTAGIISALNREDINADNFGRRVNVIQTDAAINTGSSGGALLNARGELIGIPTLKYSFDFETVYEGLGFAIPVNTIKPVIEELIEKGKVSRPRLGVFVADFEGPNEPLLNHPPAGAQVLQLDPSGAAAQAGVQLYDIIIEIEGVRVKNSDDLLTEIDRHGAGDVVNVSVYRCIDQMDGSLLKDPQMIEMQLELRIID